MSARSTGSTQRSAAWFVLVGCLAAAVHWVVVVGLVSGLGWRPLRANVVGWLVALSVSFAGHHSLSFRGHGVPAHRSAGRFVAVSALGFSINEIAYALLLRWSGHRYDTALALVLVGVAVLTWSLSRRWVFRRKP